MAIQKPEWFKMDPAKFFSDAQVDAMSTLELGACFRLLGRQWIDGHIPDNLRLLARLCRLDDASMAEAWMTLCLFFPVVETGKRANRFMWMEREKVVADLERRSDEGTRAANKRWNEARKKCGATPIAEPNGSPIPEPMQDQTRADQTRAENTFPQTQFADVPAVLSDDTKNSKLTESHIERLYSLYPRRRDKLDAKKAIRKAVGVAIAGDADHPAMPLDEALDYLAQRVTLYARCVQDCDRDYIPYPATWFNAGSFWDDEREWTSKSRLKGNGAAGTALPPGYVPASERLRQERSARAGGVL
jgi:uncharacterized protein YdaU (DUF1376 family)